MKTAVKKCFTSFQLCVALESWSKYTTCVWSDSNTTGTISSSFKISLLCFRRAHTVWLRCAWLIVSCLFSVENHFLGPSRGLSSINKLQYFAHFEVSIICVTRYWTKVVLFAQQSIMRIRAVSFFSLLKSAYLGLYLASCY